MSEPPRNVRVRFGWARGTYEGEAVIEDWDADGKHVRVIPEGWKHGITIGADEIVGPTPGSPAP